MRDELAQGDRYMKIAYHPKQVVTWWGGPTRRWSRLGYLAGFDELWSWW
jgi:hypothetical protein